MAGNSPLPICQVPGADGVPGPAINASFCAPASLAIWNGDLYFSDEKGAVYRINSDNGIASLVLGAPFASSSSLTGLSALNISLSCLWGIAFDLWGNLYVTQCTTVLRMDNVTRMVSIVAGNGVQDYSGDGGVPTAAALVPRGIAVSPEGDYILVAEAANKIIREVRLSPAVPMLCPSGYFCSCASNPVACLNSTSFCPGNTSAPLPTDVGFYGISSLTASNKVVYTLQARCPQGSFCSNGTIHLCPPGSVGLRTGQSFATSCHKCPPGTFSPLYGAVSMDVCQPCPLGHFSTVEGSSFCSPCPVGAYSSLPRGSQSCNLCPANTGALIGAGGCFLSSSNDALSLSNQFVAFQRILPVLANNMDFMSILVYGSPLLGISCLPFLLLFFSLAGLKAFSSIFKRFDLFSIKDPKIEGSSPISMPTPLGGAVSLANIGIVFFFMATTVVQFIYANSLLQQSGLPLSLPLIKKLVQLPQTQLSSEVAAGMETFTLPDLQGFQVTVFSSSGQLCSNVVGGNITFSLASGVFVPRYYFNYSTGLSFLTFTCASCQVNELSQLSFNLDISCQSLVVTVSAVGTAGGLTVSSFFVSSSNSTGQVMAKVSATFPLGLEVINDYGGGTALLQDSLVLGGRSSRGLVAVPSTSLSTVFGTPDATSVAVSIFFPAQPSYTLYTLTPLVSYIGLFSSLSGLLSLLAAGGLLLRMFEPLTGAQKIAPLRESSHVVAVQEQELGAALSPQVEVVADLKSKNDKEIGSSLIAADKHAGEEEASLTLSGAPATLKEQKPLGESPWVR